MCERHFQQERHLNVVVRSVCSVCMLIVLPDTAFAKLFQAALAREGRLTWFAGEEKLFP